MPKLIKDAQFVENDWQLVSAEAQPDEVLSLKASHLLVPFTLWQEHKAELAKLNAEIGVWFASEQNPAELLTEEEIGQLPVIALDFPLFKDGRAFTYAALLREQKSYSGDIRAVGEVLRDQLSYMLSCGFSSFQVADDVDEETYLNGFHDFSENYQATVIKPTPLFRRRQV